MCERILDSLKSLPSRAKFAGGRNSARYGIRHSSITRGDTSGKICIIRNENSFLHVLHLLSRLIKTRRKEQFAEVEETSVVS
jgi:hypothetical protein